MGGTELPTSITNTNTYQKVQRRTTTTTTLPGVIIFVHSFIRPIVQSFNRSKERERERERESGWKRPVN